jgi:hypothetical protein
MHVDAGGVAMRGVSSSPYPEPDPGRRPRRRGAPAGTGDDKHDENRLHLDLRTADLEREVERIVGLGPSLLTDHPVIEHRWRWHILADPDGTELVSCSRPPAAPHELRPRRVGGMTDVDAALIRGSLSRPPNDDPDSAGMPEKRPGRDADC